MYEGHRHQHSVSSRAPQMFGALLQNFQIKAAAVAQDIARDDTSHLNLLLASHNPGNI